MLKVAQIKQLLAPSRTNLAFVFPPNINDRASIAIDFPAPVSPVIAVKPFEKFIDNFLATAKFSIDNVSSILVAHCLVKNLY